MFRTSKKSLSAHLQKETNTCYCLTVEALQCPIPPQSKKKRHSQSLSSFNCSSFFLPPGQFVLEHHTLPGHKSHLMPPDHLGGIEFDIQLLWSAQTFDSPYQLWRATSSYSRSVKRRRGEGRPLFMLAGTSTADWDFTTSCWFLADSLVMFARQTSKHFFNHNLVLKCSKTFRLAPTVQKTIVPSTVRSHPQSNGFPDHQWFLAE